MGCSHIGGHHKAKNWGCPNTVDTNGLMPMLPGDNQQKQIGLPFYIHYGSLRGSGVTAFCGCSPITVPQQKRLTF